MGFAVDNVVRERSHQEVVNDIASARFGLDEWSIATNCDKDGNGEGCYLTPHIVATNSSEVVAIGEVETGPVCDDRARKWKELGESCARFYIFVPDGVEKDAIRLIAEHQIACAGLRSYSYNGKLEITPVHLDEVSVPHDDHPWWQAIGGADNSC